MAESSLAVTPGSGLNLRTNSRSVGGSTVHEQGVMSAEGNAATYTASAKAVSLLTSASHLLVLQADGTNYIRLRRVTIQQVGVATSATPADISIVRSTTAGSTFGTTITPVALDLAASAFSGVCGSLPSVKGTVSTASPLLQARLPIATSTITPGYRWEWNARYDNSKSIVTGTATSSGIVVYLTTGIAATTPTVDIEVEFVVTSYI